jgi:glucans biosynthesis protein
MASAGRRLGPALEQGRSLAESSVDPMDRFIRQPLPLQTAPRCGAKTRAGGQCLKPANRGKKRCRLHGGTIGTDAPKGERNGNYRNGYWTYEAIAERRSVRALVRALTA